MTHDPLRLRRSCLSGAFTGLVTAISGTSVIVYYRGVCNTGTPVEAWLLFIASGFLTVSLSGRAAQRNNGWVGIPFLIAVALITAAAMATGYQIAES